MAVRATGHTAAMVDGVWLEAAAAVSADADAQVRAEAAEVFAAEAARTRLTDLVGELSIRVRCGEIVRGTVSSDEAIDGHLVLAADDPDRRAMPARQFVVPSRAIVHVDGSRPVLREESTTVGRTLGSWLRERWSEGEIIRVLDLSGTHHAGVVTFVGSDHVQLDSSRCVSWYAVDAWWG